MASSSKHVTHGVSKPEYSNIGQSSKLILLLPIKIVLIIRFYKRLDITTQIILLQILLLLQISEQLILVLNLPNLSLYRLPQIKQISPKYSKSWKRTVIEPIIHVLVHTMVVNFHIVGVMVVGIIRLIQVLHAKTRRKVILRNNMEN